MSWTLEHVDDGEREGWKPWNWAVGITFKIMFKPHKHLMMKSHCSGRFENSACLDLTNGFMGFLVLRAFHWTLTSVVLCRLLFPFGRWGNWGPEKLNVSNWSGCLLAVFFGTDVCPSTAPSWVSTSIQIRWYSQRCGRSGQKERYADSKIWRKWFYLQNRNRLRTWRADSWLPEAEGEGVGWTRSLGLVDANSYIWNS